MEITLARKYDGHTIRNATSTVFGYQGYFVAISVALIRSDSDWILVRRGDRGAHNHTSGAWRYTCRSIISVALSLMLTQQSGPRASDRFGILVKTIWGVSDSNKHDSPPLEVDFTSKCCVCCVTYTDDSAYSRQVNQFYPFVTAQIVRRRTFKRVAAWKKRIIWCEKCVQGGVTPFSPYNLRKAHAGQSKRVTNLSRAAF